MTDVMNLETAITGGAGAVDGGGGGDGGAGGGGAPSVLPGWLQTMPEDARTPDFVARVGRYETPEALAKGLIETQDWARGRVALPKDGDDVSRREFYAKTRPESADAYTIHVPEGESSVLADAFRPFAHNIGLNTHQAESLSQFINQQTSDLISQTEQAASQELMAFRLEIGESGYTQRTEAIGAMIAASGIEAEDFLPTLQKTMGAGKAMRFLSFIAEKTGELHKVDGEQTSLAMGSMKPDAAQAAIDAHMNDLGFMAQVKIAGTPENKRWALLNRAAVVQ